MNEPIAVVALGALFPGESGTDGFWRTIVEGRDCLAEIPPLHWKLDDYYDPDPARPGRTYARRGAFLGPVPFEPLDHGVPPNMVPSTDTAQLLALVVAERLIEAEQGARFPHVDKDRIGVILGVASATELVSTMSGSLQRPVLAQALREEGFTAPEIEAVCARVDRSYVEWTESTFPGLLGNVVAGRIANRFDLGGANFVVDAACASSLGAVRMAMQELWSSGADLVITGGVDAINDIFMYMCFSKTQAMSRTGDCRPFAANADGTMLGEGIGMFALRRLSDAERDGDPIYAVLRGMGASSDGRAKSIYAPRPEGQAKALRRAYEAAGYSPSTVELVEAHGTGTPAGDAAEVAALRDVFGPGRQTCALGSIKSQIGHTKSAAGAASLFKTVMALHHRALPKTIKVSEPNPALGLAESPFYLNTELRPWVRSADHPRRAGVSAFGFGGSNFHLTLEEYKGAGSRPGRIRTLPSELFLISAASEAEARVKAEALAGRAAHGFRRAARESQQGFDAAATVRVGFVAKDAAQVAEKARRVGPGVPDIAFGTGPAAVGGVAFLFPGQGSQYVGMGSALALAFDQAIDIWDLAETLRPGLAGRVFPPPVFSAAEREEQATRLTATGAAQPALGVTEWVYLALLQAARIQPDFCAGHSFGEVTALFAAGVLSADDFLAVAAERGRLMAEVANQHAGGAMLAVTGSAGEVAPLLEYGVTLANINSPRQVVLAGSAARIEETAARLSAAGFIVHPLPVATAFHSPMVAPAGAPFTDFLRGIAWQAARTPVFSNSSAQPYPQDTNAAKALLGGQLAQPVRFAEQIEAMYQAGARCFIEVGPGGVLTGLTNVCLEAREHIAVALDAKERDAVTGLWTALAKLAAAGIAFNTEFAWQGYEDTDERPRNASSLAIPLTGTNYGKKYPRAEEPPRVRTTGAAAAGDHVAAVMRIQEQLAESHAATQRAISESHLAYLRATEAAFGHIGNGSSAVPGPVSPPAIEYRRPASVVEAPPVPVAATGDLTDLVLRIVAEKTGYPREILEPGMDLEADLGIDSIKRVQILAAVCEARPDLPQADAKNMAALRTLGAILDFLGAAAAPAPAKSSLSELVLGIVSAKTGYPGDILAPEMDLEADLGIDSIKRVQILAAVREARPDLPDVDAKQMASLRTIGAILEHLGQRSVAAPAILPPHLAKNGLARLALREVAAGANGSPALLKRGDRVRVCGEATALRDSIEQAFRTRGIQIASDGRACNGVVFVAGGGSVPRQAREAFAAAREIQGGVFATVADVACPFHRGLAALVRTVAIERPETSVKAIAIDGCDAARIVDEIIAGPSAPDVILRGGRRATFEDVSRPIGKAFDTALLQGQPVMVVSGGGRGVTASCLKGLAEVAPMRFALLGRTALVEPPPELSSARTEPELKAALIAAARQRGETVSPRDIAARCAAILSSREIHETLARLRELGSEAAYSPCDVTDAAVVSAAVDDVRARWGTIDGLIHGAGVVADKSIAEKTGEQFERVFDTKVTGLGNLLDATRGDDLRILLLFSSVAGRYGNAGQVDYAMANATICRMAVDEAARRGNGCLVRALGWGPWDGGMVTPELRAHFERRGIPVIPLDQGVAAFVQELCHPSEDPADIDVVLAAHAGERPAASQ